MLEPILGLGLGLYVAALAVYGLLAWRRSGLSLPAAVRRFFTLPPYRDEDDVRRAHMLVPLLQQGTLVVLAVAGLLAWQWRAGGQSLFILTVWLVASYLGQYMLVKNGRVRLATRLVPLTAFVITTLILELANGFHGAAVSAYCVVVVAAALLQSGRAAVFYALLSLSLIHI